MVVATGVNDTLELASPRRRGSSSSDVVPEDDGIEQSAAGATAERTDPLADGKTRSLRSRISGGTKWLGLRSKSKSPKFDADRKQFFPDDAVARPHP